MSASELFEKHEDEFLKFDRVENKRSTRPDINAFILLNELFPGTQAIVSAAEHDKIWLNIEADQMEGLTEEHVIELLRSGTLYDDEFEGLYMFV